MKYLTGSERIPPLGLPPCINIEFKHNCKPSKEGTVCNCLPVVSTCAMRITLPVHIKTDECMVDKFTFAIEDGPGFPLA